MFIQSISKIKKILCPRSPQLYIDFTMPTEFYVVLREHLIDSKKLPKVSSIC